MEAKPVIKTSKPAGIEVRRDASEPVCVGRPYGKYGLDRTQDKNIYGQKIPDFGCTVGNTTGIGKFTGDRGLRQRQETDPS